MNYENEKIKKILEEKDRAQDGEQVRVQVKEQDRVQVTAQVIGQVTLREMLEYCKLP